MSYFYKVPKRKRKGDRSGDKYRGRREEDNKGYKDDLGKKACYIVQEENDDESNDHKLEVVYVAMKDDSDEDEATILISYVWKSDRWIIDSGCSHHMTGDKSKFETLRITMEIVLDLEIMDHV